MGQSWFPDWENRWETEMLLSEITLLTYESRDIQKIELWSTYKTLFLERECDERQCLRETARILRAPYSTIYKRWRRFKSWICERMEKYSA